MSFPSPASPRTSSVPAESPRAQNNRTRRRRLPGPGRRAQIAIRPLPLDDLDLARHTLYPEVDRVPKDKILLQVMFGRKHPDYDGN